MPAAEPLDAGWMFAAGDGPEPSATGPLQRQNSPPRRRKIRQKLRQGPLNAELGPAEAWSAPNLQHPDRNPMRARRVRRVLDRSGEFSGCDIPGTPARAALIRSPPAASCRASRFGAESRAVGPLGLRRSTPRLFRWKSIPGSVWRGGRNRPSGCAAGAGFGPARCKVMAGDARLPAQVPRGPSPDQHLLISRTRSQGKRVATRVPTRSCLPNPAGENRPQCWPAPITAEARAPPERLPSRAATA